MSGTVTGDKYLGIAVKSIPVYITAFGEDIRFLATRITITHSQNLAVTNIEVNSVFSSRYYTSFGIQHFYGNDSNVVTIALDRSSVFTDQLQGSRISGSFHQLGVFLSVLLPFGQQLTRGIFNTPSRNIELFNRLFTQAFAIQEQFHLIHIGIQMYIDRIRTDSIPMRKHMQHRFFRPPSLVIPECIFRETAIV